MKIYLIEECGDQYHGTRPVEAYLKKIDAETAANKLKTDQQPCECGFTYHYSITEIQFWEKV